MLRRVSIQPGKCFSSTLCYFGLCDHLHTIHMVGGNSRLGDGARRSWGWVGGAVWVVSELPQGPSLGTMEKQLSTQVSPRAFLTAWTKSCYMQLFWFHELPSAWIKTAPGLVQLSTAALVSWILQHHFQQWISCMIKDVLFCTIILRNSKLQKNWPPPSSSFSSFIFTHWLNFNQLLSLQSVKHLKVVTVISSVNILE